MKLTTLSLSALAVGHSALAAPLIGGVAPLLGSVGGAVPGGGSVLPGAGGVLPGAGGILPAVGGATAATGDLKVFADAVLKLTTGGTHSSCDALATQLHLTAATQAQVLTKFAYGACVTAYHDQQTCSGLAGYFASTFYAYVNGWVGGDLFASLGSVRITHWHDLLSHTCTWQQNGPVCQPIFIRWDAYIRASTSFNLNATIVSNHLTNLGYLNCIDNPAALLGLLSGLGVRDVAVDSNTHANGHAAASVDNHGINAAAVANAVTVNDVKIGNQNVKLVSVGNVFAGAHATRDIAVNSNMGAHAFTGVKLDHNGLDAAAVANAATFNNVKVGHNNVNVAGVSNTFAGASVHKRADFEPRILLLDRPLELTGVGNGHLLSTTELTNGNLASSTLGKATGLLSVIGRDIKASTFTSASGEGSLRVGDIIIDGSGSAHVVGHVSA